MNLRRCFYSRQLLFLLAAFGFLVRPGYVLAEDTIVMKDGKTQPAKVVNVMGSTVQVQVGAGTVGIPITQIAQVNMAPPPEFAAAMKAFEAKDYPKALSTAQAVLSKYKGLPADWAEQTAAMLGDIYVAMNDLGRAERAYRDLQTIHPETGAVHSEVGLARIAASKKDFATAKQKLEPILAKALKLENVPKALGSAYGQAFYVSGQVKEAEGDNTGALEDYLRTVTIFHHDRVAVASAQERADALRQAQNVTVP